MDGPKPRARRRWAILLGAALLAGLALLPWALTPRGVPFFPPPARFSLLAVGDTGQPPTWLPWLAGQTAVASGLDEEDRRAPSDGLLLLGDNFYERGLKAEELVSRVRGNLVTPYCRFVQLDGSRSDRGTGLGLAIARMIARLHGGDVVAGASPLGGARFELRVPRSASRAR